MAGMATQYPPRSLFPTAPQSPGNPFSLKLVSLFGSERYVAEKGSRSASARERAAFSGEKDGVPFLRRTVNDDFETGPDLTGLGARSARGSSEVLR